MKAILDKLLIGKKDVIGLAFKFKGRLRGSTRSKKRLLRWGKQYMQDRLSRVRYSAVVINSKQGSIGVKIASTLIRKRWSKPWKQIKVLTTSKSTTLSTKRLISSFKSSLAVNGLRRKSVGIKRFTKGTKYQKSKFNRKSLFRSIRFRSGKGFVSFQFSLRNKPMVVRPHWVLTAKRVFIKSFLALYPKIVIQCLYATSNISRALAFKQYLILNNIVSSMSTKFQKLIQVRSERIIKKYQTKKTKNFVVKNINKEYNDVLNSLKTYLEKLREWDSVNKRRSKRRSRYLKYKNKYKSQNKYETSKTHRPNKYQKFDINRTNRPKYEKKYRPIYQSNSKAKY